MIVLRPLADKIAGDFCGMLIEYLKKKKEEQGGTAATADLEMQSFVDAQYTDLWDDRQRLFY